MNHPRIINENMLDEWVRGNSRTAQGVTVELVGRLVAASCPSPDHRRFPLPDSIGQHGPDGELDTPVGLPPSVPDGRSFWEIGAGLDARAKANSDYTDLTAVIPKDVRESSSFVFVTPLSGRRDWESTWKEDGIATWVEERRRRKDWADVRVLNGTSLIDWLYRFPAVERWLAGVMGMKIDFIETLDARWETLRMIGNPPPLCHELFTSNRDNALLKLQRLVIDRDGTQLKLDTRHPEQAADFVSAYASSLSEEQRIEAIGRCLIVTREDAWSDVCSLNESHILVADFDLESDKGLKLIQSALNRRHAVIFAGMPGGVPHANRAPLPMPDEYQIKAALEKAGHQQERSRRLANACRSDLNSLLRCLQGLSAMPEWAQMTDAAEIAIAMLIGGWSENTTGDSVAVEAIVGKRYGEWITVVRRTTSAMATPLQFRNGCWHMVSRFESWQLLGRLIFNDDLARFEAVAISVLRQIDPALELAPEDRFAAGMYGKESVHSSRLRKGIAETLALLGAYPKALTACTDGSPEATAANAVQKILTDGSWELWASLNDVLPLLAEASPNQFTEAIDAAIHSESGAFNKVFAQESSGIGGRTYITGLLWGLESLAWDPNYLVQVCRILADLAALDPGGNWDNRPSNSLTTILLPWIPQTCASADKRYAAVRVVARRQPEIAWKLVVSLLPKTHSVSSGAHKPIWRPFIAEDWKDGASPVQYSEDVMAYGQIAIELAGTDVEKVSQLVKIYFNLPDEIQRQVRELLVSDDILQKDERSLFILWQTLNQLTTNHRKFADNENWKVRDGSLEQLDEIAVQLRPDSPEIRHKRLFSGVNLDLYEQKGNWREQEEKLSVERQGAVREIVGKGGATLLLQFAKESGEPWRVGVIYGSLMDLADDNAVLPSLIEASDKELLQFAGGYVWGRHRTGGWAWVDSVSFGTWPTSAQGQFFTFLPFCEETWLRVSAGMAGDEKYYWQKTSANPYESKSGLDDALDKLIDHDRPDVAIQCIHLMLHKKTQFPISSALRALQSLTPEHRLDAYAVGELLTALQEEKSVDESDVRILEWKFLPFLGRFNNGQPVSLSRWLAEDADFFCEVIQMVYRSKKDKEKQPEPSEELMAKAKKAYYLLNEWTLPPGTQRDRSFSPEVLTTWIASSKAKCMESGHWEVASGQIGQVLRYAPVDANGLWIEPVCAVLDEDDHSKMRSGLTMEIFNGRGVYTPDGGRWESAAADEWNRKADFAETKGFSLLAEELRRLSRSYRSDAEREAKGSHSEVQ